MVMTAGGLSPIVQRVQATSHCTTSSPGPAYSVMACITVPSSGATLIGTSTVTATFTITLGTGPTSLVQRAVFYFGGADLDRKSVV